MGENICKHISCISEKALNGIYKENIKEINQLKSAKDVNHPKRYINEQEKMQMPRLGIKESSTILKYYTLTIMAKILKTDKTQCCQRCKGTVGGIAK